jgi:hypothetical protein
MTFKRIAGVCLMPAAYQRAILLFRLYCIFSPCAAARPLVEFLSPDANTKSSGHMNQSQPAKAPLAAALKDKHPDVIVTHADQTALFTPQNQRAAEWLHRRCGLAVENISGDTEIRVHPRKCQRVITDLKAVGFVVANDGEEQ